MKAFAVSHNGQKVAVVGVSENCYVTVSVVGMVGDLVPQEVLLLQLHRVSAVDQRPDIWPMRPLAVGDEITIRIVDVESDDPPPKRFPRRPKSPPRRKNPGEDFNFGSRFGRFK